MVAFAVLLAACAEGQSSPSTTVSATTTSTPPTTAIAETESQVFELLESFSHPNGAQLRIDRLELLTDSTVVSGSLTNGSAFGLDLGRGTTELATSDGTTVELLEPFHEGEIAPATEVSFSMRFEPIPVAEAVTLRVNAGGGASATDPSTASPTFEVGPIALDATARPSLPDPVPVNRSVLSDSGIEMQLEGVNFSENRIGLWVRISNPLDTEARIAPAVGPSVIVDDMGNRYPLVLPIDETFISIPAQSARSGVLSFAGRVSPSATALDIVLNAAASDIQDGGRIFPLLIVEDLPLEGDPPLQPLPGDVGLDNDPIVHPAGVTANATLFTFTETGAAVSVSVANDSDRAVRLAASPSYLVDDLDNRYPLLPLTDNPTFTVEPGTELTATLSFSGRMSGGASSIRLFLNAGESADNPESTRPAITFGPVELTRSGSPPPPVEAQVFTVTEVSRLVEDELARSEIDQITQTLTEFGAEEVEGGFQLTLPDSILFDFGATELRGDADQALTLIAEVFEFYGDAEVIVVGHTDSIGSDSANQALSEQRAQAVIDALVSGQGVDASRLRAEGRGESEPIAPNESPDGEDNPEGRQLNRRVEIIVLTDEEVPVP